MTQQPPHAKTAQTLVRQFAVSVVGALPGVRSLRRQRNELGNRVKALEGERDALALEMLSMRSQPHPEPSARGASQWSDVYGFFPPGHYYSTIPDLDDVQSREQQIFSDEVPLGIPLNIEEQLVWVESQRDVLEEWPYRVGRNPGHLRYRPENPMFGFTDGQILYAQMRSDVPRRIIEIGSGWSTSMMLDAIEIHGLPTTVDCVEPYPERLLSTLKAGDRERISLHVSPVQDVPVKDLVALEPGDILFIDSSHVSKVGSDVNFLFFEVLPRLKPGVRIHVHDIGYPFETSKEWAYTGRFWNEVYLIRALLMDSARYRVAFWAPALWSRAHERFGAVLDPRTKRHDGGSIWLDIIA